MVGVMVDRSVSAWAQKGSQAMQMRCLTLYPQPAESNLYGRQPPTHEATTCNNGYQPSTALLPMPNWDREWAGPMKNLNLVRPSTDKKKHILPVCVIESHLPLRWNTNRTRRWFAALAYRRHRHQPAACAGRLVLSVKQRLLEDARFAFFTSPTQTCTTRAVSWSGFHRRRK